MSSYSPSLFAVCIVALLGVYVVASSGATRSNDKYSPEYWFLSAKEMDDSRQGLSRRATGMSTFTSGNIVTPLVDGEEMMTQVAKDFIATKKGDFMHLTFWRVEMTQVLLPSATNMTLSLESSMKTMLTDMHNRGVSTKYLVNRNSMHLEATKEFSDYINGLSGGNSISVVDARFPSLGSHHQKSIILTRNNEAVAYVGGIDLCFDRWDTRAHSNKDPRRIPLNREMMPGWHDVHAYIRGPAVSDVERNFFQRWNDPQMPQLLSFAPQKYQFPKLPNTNIGGSHHVQILRTYPCGEGYSTFARKGEFSILKAYEKAISKAKQYIYIEDQYAVSPRIAAALSKALPNIEALVIVSQNIPASGTGTEGIVGNVTQALYSYHQQVFINKLTSDSSQAHKFHFFNLTIDGMKPWERDSYIYLHSKVLIVDDIFAIIGSQNLNKRSMTHDTELAVAVVDEEARISNGKSGFAKSFRLNLWAEHLTLNDTQVIDDPILGLKEWQRQANTGVMRVRNHRTLEYDGSSFMDEEEWEWMDSDGLCSKWF